MQTKVWKKTVKVKVGNQSMKLKEILQYFAKKENTAICFFLLKRANKYIVP